MPELNLQDWESEKKKILSAWLEFLGKGPDCREVSGLKILSTHAVGNCVREKVQYDVYPGCTVEAYVIRPLKISDRYPAIVSLHQTIDCTIDEVAGLAGSPDLHIGLHLAERGFVTINPRCFLWERQGLSFEEAAAALKQQFPSWTGMGRMLWDTQCAVDVLCSLPYVDEKLIGTIGHSLGGKEAFYLAAFDPRVKATVCSEMGIGLDMSNWNAEHYLGSAVSHAGFPLSHHEILALIAPKPFLLIGGDKDDDKRSDELYIRQVQSIYQLYNAGEKIKFFDHHRGHTFPVAAQDAAYHWLEEWL
ncbi:MAG: dienelactone hydrolase family protein [Victivallaceae bacterium]